MSERIRGSYDDALYKSTYTQTKSQILTDFQPTYLVDFLDNTQIFRGMEGRK